MKKLLIILSLIPSLGFSQNRPAFEWVEIRTGQFEMGSPDAAKVKREDEIEHTVSIVNEYSGGRSAIKMSKYEVTFDQYDAFCDATGRQKPNDNGWGRGDRPVINVSWDDASDFAQWMGGRLPTEAEWEYACRAGRSYELYAFGDSLTVDHANISVCYPINCKQKSTAKAKTMPVGSYRENEWGLADMHGNVWEWCSDWYDEYKKGRQSNPTGPDSGTMKVMRGGAYDSNARMCRSANRGHMSPKLRKPNIGFRIVVLNY